jgi:hypothetical protein
VRDVETDLVSEAGSKSNCGEAVFCGASNRDRKGSKQHKTLNHLESITL